MKLPFGLTDNFLEVKGTKGKKFGLKWSCDHFSSPSKSAVNDGNWRIVDVFQVSSAPGSFNRELLTQTTCLLLFQMGEGTIL